MPSTLSQSDHCRIPPANTYRDLPAVYRNGLFPPDIFARLVTLAKANLDASTGRRGVGHPQVSAAVAMVESGLHDMIVDRYLRCDEKTCEEIFRRRRMVQVITCSGEGPNQQGTALAKIVLNRGDGSV